MIEMRWTDRHRIHASSYACFLVGFLFAMWTNYFPRALAGSIIGIVGTVVSAAILVWVYKKRLKGQRFREDRFFAKQCFEQADCKLLEFKHGKNTNYAIKFAKRKQKPDDDDGESWKRGIPPV